MAQMSSLFVTINTKKKTAVFSGPGTFHAKEEIKQLGQARWQGDEKNWLVSNFTRSSDELLMILPQAEIEYEDGSKEESKETAASPKKIKPKELSSKLPEGYSVSELVHQARGVIHSVFSEITYVYGVVQKVKRYPGRVYLDLAESSSSKESISCVIWGAEEQLLKPLLEKGFKLEPELEVMFAVKVDLNPSRANLSLNIKGVVPEYTFAKVQALREKTNAKLKEEGLFELNKTKELPLLPKRLGILTSRGGTVINDFKAALDVAEFSFKLFWHPVSVQGTSSKKEIVKGIKELSKNYNLDAILLFRGGGSVSDLMIFNEYEVAKAVAKCPLPVFSAIGHQEDQSSAQDVSFQSFGVPKDLGHFFAGIIENLRSEFFERVSEVNELSNEIVSDGKTELKNISDLINNAGLLLISEKKERCRSFSQSVSTSSNELLKRSYLSYNSLKAPLMSLMKQQLRSKENIFINLSSSMKSSIIKKIEFLNAKIKNKTDFLVEQIANKSSEANLKLKAFENSFSELDPKIQLKRGFALIKKIDLNNKATNEYITRASKLKKGSSYKIELGDGVKTAEIK